MRKKLLFRRLFIGLSAIFFALTLSAQTDVTSTYLSNADFETSPTVTTTSPTDNTVYTVSGWTSNTTANFKKLFSMPYNSTLASTPLGVTSPTNGSSVTSGNRYLLAIKSHWQPGANYLQQTITLPAGKYALKWDSYVMQVLTSVLSYCGVIINGSAYYAPLADAVTTWKNNTLYFTLTSSQSVIVRFGYDKCGNVGGTSSPVLFVDNVKLYSYGVDKTDLVTKISQAKAYYSTSGTGADTYKTAIRSAESVNSNSGATQSDVNSAITTLQTAMDTYVSNNKTDVTTTYISNPSFETASLASWTNSSGYASQTNTPGQTWIKDGTNYAEKYIAYWSTTSGTAVTPYLAAATLSQTKTSVTNGVYRMTLSAHAIQQGLTSIITTGASAYANSASTSINIGGNYTVDNIAVTNGTLNFGYKLVAPITCNWTGLDNFKLYYIGNIVRTLTPSSSTMLLNSVSYSQTFNLTGSNILDDITFTVPSHITLSGTNVINNGDGTYKISSENANATNTVTVNWDNLVATSGNITISSTGATSATILASGSFDPLIVISKNSMSFSTTANTGTFDITGSNLTSDITINTVPTGLTLSGSNIINNGDGTYKISSANVNSTNTITTTWSKTNNITSQNIIIGSTGATSQNISTSTTDDVESVAISGITLSSGNLNTSFAAGTTSYTTKAPADVTTTIVSATATPASLATVTNSGTTISASTSSVTLTGNSYNTANHTSGYTVTWGGNYTLSDWSANGSTDATLSLPTVYGWSASPSITWKPANDATAGTVRYVDNPASYTYNGTSWPSSGTGRILYVRWDGSLTRVYSYPVYLEACKNYIFTCKAAYNSVVANGTLTFRINTTKDTASVAYGNGTNKKARINLGSTAYALKDVSLTDISVPTTGIYYLTISSGNGALDAIADLSLTQNLTETLTSNQTSLVFDHNHLTKTFTVTGNVLSNDITLTAPTGISLNPSTITAANAQCGVTVTATFDDATTISNGTISATSGSLSQNITVNTSIDNVCFTPAYNDRTNLIADPYLNQLSNFPNSWGTGTIVTGTDAYCGYGSGKVSGAYGGSITTSNISWTPNTSYRMRALIKTDGVFQFGLQNSYAVEGNNAATYENQIASTSNSWQQVDFTFTTGASAVAGFTYFNNYGRSGTLGYIDNWELYQVATPSVTINYLDGSNNVLKTARTVSSALNIGSSYTALASDTAAFSASATESWIFDKSSVSSVLIAEGGNTINLKFNKVNNSILSYSVSTTGNWSSNSVWSRGTVPGAGAQITVNGGTLTIDQDASPSNITVAPGAKLSLNSGINLNTSSLIIQSDASGTATFVDADATGKTVTGTIQQYLPTGRNWYVGIPIANADNSTTASSLTAGGATSVSYWDEPTGAWVNDYAGSLTKGRGYIAVSGSGSATNNISFTGTFNTGSIPVTVTRTVGVTKEGFNLIANPYPSYLNPCDLITASSKMEPTIWYRTKGAAYSFETVNTASGEGTNGVTGYIPPMQAFWVRVKTNATDAAQNNSETLTFTNAMRYHANPSGVTTTALKAPKSIQNMLLRLQVSNGTNTDEAIIYANTNASNAYDLYDSHKMSNNSALIPEIYTTVGSEQLVINGLSEIPLNTEIPLGFNNLQSGTNSFKLRASELRNISSDTKVFLLDKSTNAETELTATSDYTFTSEAANTTSRFSVIFKSAGQTTGTDNASDKKAIVYTNNGQIVFVANEVPTGDNNSLMIFDATGRKVADRNITSTVTGINNINIQGVYLVRAIVNGQPYSAKINLNH